VRLRDSSRRIYRGHIRQHCLRLFDGVLLSELHVGHLVRAFRRLFDEGMTPATARRLFSTLRTALNAAARERLIPDNPARYVKLPRGPGRTRWSGRSGESRSGNAPGYGPRSRCGPRPSSCSSWRSSGRTGCSPCST
jgi:hypothetical protein